MTDTAIGQRDEQVAEAIVSGGRSLRLVQKQFGLSAGELDAVLERLWPVDAAARIRMIKRDVGRLEALMAPFYERAVKDRDVPSGVLVVKVFERLHELCGLNSAARVDLQIITQPKEMRSFNKIREAVYRVARGPDWHPDAGNGSPSDGSNSGDGAGGVLSPPSDTPNQAIDISAVVLESTPSPRESSARLPASHF